ncbi:MAG TPA: hypothetical protein EYQ14_09000 [Gammaproteobacteria bacterium]|nr:hypothetical protein [Gammaproteobacteria bacterium]
MVLSQNQLDQERLDRIRQQRKKQKLSVVFTMPDLTESGQVLSSAEIEFFKENGFLVKKKLLDPEKLTVSLGEAWRHLLDFVPIRKGSGWQLSRQEQSSWLNPQWAEMEPLPTSGPYEGRQPIEHYGRIVKMHDIYDADYLATLLPRDQKVRLIVEHLLGENLKPNVSTRGVYAIFPTRNAKDPTGKKRLTGSSLGPHTDQVCQQLNVCASLDDVSPRNGGFTVYPGSHKIMFQQHEFEANWSPLDSFDDSIQSVAEQIEPLELVAEKGACIFWHGRLVHTSGIHIGEDIRWAVFSDFTHDRSTVTEAEHRRLGQYEWFKDTKLFRNDQRVSEDMWASWKV